MGSQFCSSCGLPRGTHKAESQHVTGHDGKPCLTFKILKTEHIPEVPTSIPGDITSLVDAHRQASLQSTMNSIGGGSLEPAHTIERNARHAILEAFSTLQAERDDLRDKASAWGVFVERGQYIEKITALEGQLSRLRAK